jgi:hypothetical protein
MALYRVLAPTFAANVLWPAGSIIEFDGPPGDNLTLALDQTVRPTLPVETVQVGPYHDIGEVL